MAKKVKAEPIKITQLEVINYAIMTVGPKWMKEREMLMKLGEGVETSMYYPKLVALLQLYKLQSGEDYQIEADGWTLDV